MDRLAVVLAVCVLVAAAVVVLRRRRSRLVVKRVRPSDFGPTSADGPGLVLFSSPYCVDCQAWERELARAGVGYRAEDVSVRGDLAARYDITRTPVLLAYDARDGTVLWSCTEPPTTEHLRRLEALGIKACAPQKQAEGRTFAS